MASEALESLPLLSSQMQPRVEDIRDVKQRRLDPMSASANLVNTIVGAGMMALPAAYLNLGLIGGTAIMALVGSMTFFTLDVLARATLATDVWTYGELTDAVVGSGHALALKVRERERERE